MSDVKFPSDLLIFSPSTSTQPLWAQWRAKARPARDGLGPLVLVVGELEVQAARVEVEVLAEQLERHDHALGVPPGPPGAEGRAHSVRPASRLPQGEVERRTLLLVGLDAGARAQRVEGLAGEQPVVGDDDVVEVDAVTGHVGDAARRAARDEVDHLATYSVAWGVSSGRSTPSRSIASHHCGLERRATSGSSCAPRSARAMILSSMSVMFET